MNKKRFLIIFIMMIISIIPTLKVEALITVDQLPELPTLTHNNPYTIIKDKDDVIRLYIIPTSNLTNINGEKGIITIPNALHFGGGFSTIFGTSYSYHVYCYKIVDNAWKYVGYSSYGYTYSPSDFGISTEDYSLDPSIIEDYLDDVLIYNNINYYYPHNGEYVKRFQKKNELLDVYPISITNFYLLQFLANDFNINYKYMIKTDLENEFTDITNLLNHEYNNYFTELHYNTTIYMKVLDSNNEVIYTKDYVISDISTSKTSNTFSSSDLYSVDLIYESFNADNIGKLVDFELQYVGENNDPNNLPTFIGYSIYGLDENNKIINTDLNDYFYLSYDYLPYYDGDYERIIKGSLHLLQPLPHNVFNIQISFKFNDLSDYYIICSTNYLNSYISYTKEYMKDYVKYIFPTNYNIAIIRSKSFSDIDSYLMSNDYYFTSGRFTLYDYDFINNNFLYSYTNYKSYIFNNIYLQIPITINETNNIFPILYKDFNEEETEFFLHKDLFVEFLNSSDLNYKIDNIDYDTFNSNDDLLIFGSIDTVVTDYFKLSSDNQSFFNTFKNSLNRFKNVIIDIFQNCTYFYNNLNVLLKDFFIVIFVIILFLFLIKFIL